MLNIFLRISWILSVTVGLSIVAIDEELWFVGLLVAIITKLFLSRDFFAENILSYNERLKASILAAGNQNIAILSTEVSQEEVMQTKQEVHNETIAQTQQQISTSDTKESISVLASEYKEENKGISEEIPSKPGFIRSFFAENVMAKVGGILLALGVVYLMLLVFIMVGPVMKIILGFVIGFGLYGIGVKLIQKDYKNEGMVLLGVGILANYIVILSGRHLMGNDGLISGGVAFLFLILNTAFSVLTGFLYQSKKIVLFSLFFAYFVPFLVGSSGSAYSYIIVLGYGALLTLASIFLVSKNMKDGDTFTARYLLYISLILGNLLIFVSPIPAEGAFLAKILAFNLSLFLIGKSLITHKFTKDFAPMLLINFVTFGLFVSSAFARLDDIGTSFIAMSFILVSLIVLLVISAYSLIVLGGMFLMGLLFFPLLLAIMFPFSGLLGLLVIPLFVFLYCMVFVKLGLGIFAGGIRYVFFIILGGALTFSNLSFSLNVPELTLLEMLVVISTALMFFAFTYYQSFKQELLYLYPLGTFLTFFTLFPFLETQGSLMMMSVLSLGIFGGVNFIFPFINKQLQTKETWSLVFGQILGVLAISFYLFQFGNLHFPGVALGISFFVLAALYSFAGYFFFQKIQSQSEKGLISEGQVNGLYAFGGISLSLFTISIAMVFASQPMIIAVVWLVQSTLLYFFANRLNSAKVVFAAIILFFIGTVELFDINITRNLSEWVGIVIALGAIFANAFFVARSSHYTWLSNTLHLIAVGVLAFIIMDIQYNYFMGFLAILFGLSRLFYVFYCGNFLRIASTIAFALLFFFEIAIYMVFDEVFLDEGSYLVLIVGLLVGIIEFLFSKNSNTLVYASFYAVYFFIITSIYLYDANDDALGLTIYWGGLLLTTLWFGLVKNIRFLRTVGLYILILTLIKITLYDIWNTFDNPIFRVIGLMGVGGVMVYISTLYSKYSLKISNDLWFTSDTSVGEESKISPDTKSSKISPDTKSSKFSPEMLNNIYNTDTSMYTGVKFILTSGENITIKSQGLLKIVVFFLDFYKKNTFLPEELLQVYNYLVDNYESQLSKSDYNKLISILGDFVMKGGEVEFIKK